MRKLQLLFAAAGLAFWATAALAQNLQSDLRAKYRAEQSRHFAEDVRRRLHEHQPPRATSSDYVQTYSPPTASPPSPVRLPKDLPFHIAGLSELLDKFPDPVTFSAGSKAMPDLQAFRSNVARCQILLPAGVQQKQTDAQGLTLKSFGYANQDGCIGLNVVQSPSSVSLNDSDTCRRLLEGGAKGACDNVHATMTSQRHSDCDGYPALDVDATFNEHKGVLRQRIVLAHGRMYQVMLAGTPEFANSDKAFRSFSSLHIYD